jgi:hypothetical protein
MQKLSSCIKEFVMPEVHLFSLLLLNMGRTFWGCQCQEILCCGEGKHNLQLQRGYCQSCKYTGWQSEASTRWVAANWNWSTWVVYKQREDNIKKTESRTTLALRMPSQQLRLPGCHMMAKLVLMFFTMYLSCHRRPLPSLGAQAWPAATPDITKDGWS